MPPTTNNDLGTNVLGGVERAVEGLSRAIVSATPSFSSNKHKFSVSRSAAYTTTSSVFTLMPFDTITFDTSSGFSTATGRFTVSVSGYYQFNFRLSSASGTAPRFITTLYKNGLETIRGADITCTTPSSVGSAFLFCAAGDIVDVRYYVTGAVALELGYQTFQGFLVTQV